MKLRTRLIILLAGPVMYAVACSSPNAPVDQGGIVFRFVPEGNATRPARAGGIEDALDSVVVRVFRPGSPIAQEVARGASVGVDPVELTIACIAEANKRVSVELFASGMMVYHGVNEDVDVVASRATDVLVDAFPFHVDSLSAKEDIVPDGSPFDLTWSSTAGARTYRVEASASPDFASIEWTQSLTDTVASATLPPGAHYFRVAPASPFATGAYAGPEPGYVTGGSGNVVVTGFSAPGVIPGETVSVYGENLDHPETQVVIGSTFMEIVSASWGELVVRMPRTGKTDLVSVASALGSDVSPDRLIALRVAYVTATGEFAQSFKDLMASYATDIERSGVVSVPIEELDTRDMSVFDVIVVANDTGTDLSDWGGGITSRAEAIVTSGANVLAMGDGGLAFLALELPVFRVQVTIASETSCHVPGGQVDQPVFQNPHSIVNPGSVLLGESFDVCQNKERRLSMNPPVTNKYASTVAASNLWVFMDHLTASQRFFFWGFAADPAGFTKSGGDFLANVMVLLYN